MARFAPIRARHRSPAAFLPLSLDLGREEKNSTERRADGQRVSNGAFASAGTGARSALPGRSAIATRPGILKTSSLANADRREKTNSFLPNLNPGKGTGKGSHTPRFPSASQLTTLFRGERAKRRFRFRPLTPKEMLAANATTGTVSWVWHRFFSENSLNLFTAFMKKGKTTLAYELAMAVAR